MLKFLQAKSIVKFTELVSANFCFASQFNMATPSTKNCAKLLSKYSFYNVKQKIMENPGCQM